MGTKTIILAGLFLCSSVLLPAQEAEGNFTLDEALITAQRKNGKKQHRAQMRQLLDRIYDRLITVDAPEEGERFDIISDIKVLSDSVIIVRSRVAGVLFEWPGGRKDGKDSVSLEVTYCANYLDSAIKEGFDKLDADDFKGREKKISESADRYKSDTTKLHKAVWKVADSRTVLKGTYDDEKMWNSQERDDSTLMVTGHQKKGFLGIVSAVQNVIMTVDSRTYAIRDARCDISVKVRLPFGYRLSPEDLEILNLVNLTGDDVEKFKIKSADIRLFGSVTSRDVSDRMIPADKRMKNTISIADRKGNRIRFDNTCSLSVIQQ